MGRETRIVTVALISFQSIGRILSMVPLSLQKICACCIVIYIVCVHCIVSSYLLYIVRVYVTFLQQGRMALPNAGRLNYKSNQYTLHWVLLINSKYIKKQINQLL